MTSDTKKPKLGDLKKLPLGFEHVQVISKKETPQPTKTFFYSKRCRGEVRFQAFYKAISRLY